jgi:Protein of unknown function (DUF1631)
LVVGSSPTRPTTYCKPGVWFLGIIFNTKNLPFIQTFHCFMATSTASDSDIFKQCMQRACAQSRDVMVQLVRQAVAVMQAKQNTLTDMRERIVWDDDTRALLQQSELLADRFPQALRTAIDKVIQTKDASAKDPQSAGSNAKPAARALRFETLELVDDAKVQSQIDHSRLQQAAENACEKELGMLDALVCAARGLKIVQPERNPLRPHTFCTALIDTLAYAEATPAQRAVWMQQLGALLGPELRKLYPKLVEFLQNERVQAVGYSGNFSYGGQSNAVAGDAGATAGAGQAQSSAAARSPALPKRERSANAPRLSVGQLRQALGGQHFQADTAAAQNQNTADDTYNLDDVMRDVQELSALVQQLGGPAIKRAGTQARQVDDAAESELHTSKADALEVYEEHEGLEGQAAETDAHPAQALDAAAQGALAQDVVRLLLDELCDDMRLLQCVRNWVGSLEPALLALANTDNTFLTQATHPARRLLDEVTARSMGFGSEQSEGFAAFFDPVLEACAQIQPSGIISAQPFVQAWSSVEQAWSQQKSAAQIQREQAQQALVEAEQRNLLAEKIALELTRRDDARFAPIFVKQFMAGVWSQVLAKSRLDPQAHVQAAKYLDVVASLLWSAVPEQIAADKKRLVSVVPSMLAALREGLASIGGSEHLGDAFFAQLMQVHELVLKSGHPKQGTKPVQEQALAQAAEEKFEKSVADGNENPVWIAPQEMRVSGFVSSGFVDSDPAALADTTINQAAESDFLSTEPQTSEQVAPQFASALPDGTFTQPPPLGAWVEFLSHDKWVRAQLTWASPHGTLYMFTGAAGNPHSMTRRALDKMLSRQAMRSAAEGSFVMGALNAVAQAAQRHSAIG